MSVLLLLGLLVVYTETSTAQSNEMKCYDELGCFPMDHPWTSLTRPLPPPMSPVEIGVQLYCYTSASPTSHNVTLWPEVSLNGCLLHNDVGFIIHGFVTNANFPWISELKDQYLSAKGNDTTVFVVDWGEGAIMLNYFQVASNTRIVGAELARFIKVMQAKQGLRPDHVHLMGHSLGAQVAGYVGKRVPGIQRITGLDPAQPQFEMEDDTVKLIKDDADFVDIIHTNALPLIPFLGFGTIMPHGMALLSTLSLPNPSGHQLCARFLLSRKRHVDFYMNGGLRQPGCLLPQFNSSINSLEDLATIPIEVLVTLTACSHERAINYFTSALKKNCSLWGRAAHLSVHLAKALTMYYPNIDPLISTEDKCTRDTCTPLGLDTPKFKARGVFGVKTGSSAPYCDGDAEKNRRIIAEIKENDSKNTSQGTLDSLKALVNSIVGSSLPWKMDSLPNVRRFI